MAEQQIKNSQISTPYSATEQDTGKTWVDGRPIYRKVLRGQLNVSAIAMTIAHGISFTANMEIISVQGFIKLGQGSGGGDMQSLQMYRELAGNWIGITTIQTANIQITSSFAWGLSYYVITLEYVK